jgi:hypothetical protein
VDSGPDISFHNEQLQVAAINYENNTEKLAIAVKLDKLGNRSAVWLVPIPAKPEDIKMDVLQSFPYFYGTDLVLYTDKKVDEITYLPLAASLTQIYPGVFVLPYLYYLANNMGANEGGIQIHADIQKGGITSQVITADNTASLYNYLKNMNIMVEEGSLPIFEEYIGKNYSFVASWVRSINESDYRAPSIFVEFPSNEIYYPMKPTSMYGDTKVPVLIYVIGFVQPKLYAEIANYTLVRYIKGSIGNYNGTLGPFYDKPVSNYSSDLGHGEFARINYTEIIIGSFPEMWRPGILLVKEDPPAKNFIEDIYMGKPGNPPGAISAKLSKADLLDAMVSPSAVIIWILATSILSGIIAGHFVFRKVKKSALIAISNCLTIIALIIATFALFKKEDGDRTRFLVAFSLIFLVINYLFAMILGSILHII